MTGKLVTTFLLLAGLWCGAADSIDTMLKGMKKHPRLLPLNLIADNAQTFLGILLKERILKDADKILTEPPEVRNIRYNSLLYVSRNILFRVNTLTHAYYLSNDRKYAVRAIQEMLAAANFTDWYPEHFLDTAEMTLALAFGYDSLYSVMNDEERNKIAAAIIEKGLKPGDSDKLYWVSRTNNWNFVCHAGLTAGALAVYENEPELAVNIISRALKNVPIAMRFNYAPNGACPEGPMYWEYGTEFHCILIGMLKNTLGNVFDLDKMAGFEQTALYPIACLTPLNTYFTYSDTLGHSQWNISFASFFLADYFKRPDFITATDRKLFKKYAEKDRMMPFALSYMKNWPEGKNMPLSYFSGASAQVPIAVYRTGYEPAAAYLGIKAGSAAGPHGHQDCGSFIYVNAGVIWAEDLGMQGYSRLENRGIKLWDYSQNSDRWKVFRLGPRSHNILMIDNHNLNVKGKAEISKFSDVQTVVELSSVYQEQARQVTRTFDWDSGNIRISDQLDGLKPGATVRWQMCTRCNAEIINNSIVLTNKSKKMRLSIEAPQSVQWRITPEEQLRHEWDAPNPQAKMIEFEITAPKSGNLSWRILFTPIEM